MPIEQTRKPGADFTSLDGPEDSFACHLRRLRLSTQEAVSLTHDQESAGIVTRSDDRGFFICARSRAALGTAVELDADFASLLTQPHR